MNSMWVTTSFIVEFIVRNQQCTDCNKLFMNDEWRSLVQVRYLCKFINYRYIFLIFFHHSQKVSHKRTFYALEQLIINNNAQERCTVRFICININLRSEKKILTCTI